MGWWIETETSARRLIPGSYHEMSQCMRLVCEISKEKSYLDFGNLFAQPSSAILKMVNSRSLVLLNCFLMLPWTILGDCILLLFSILYLLFIFTPGCSLSTLSSLIYLKSLNWNYRRNKSRKVFRASILMEPISIAQKIKLFKLWFLPCTLNMPLWNYERLIVNIVVYALFSAI